MKKKEDEDDDDWDISEGGSTSKLPTLSNMNKKK